MVSAPFQSPLAQRNPNSACDAQVEAGASFSASSAIMTAATRIVGALRFDEQSAQAEQPGVLALGHGAEGALRAFAVAVELGGLRVQQQRQRIVRGMAARDVGMAAGRGGIAVADRQQSVRDGVAAAGLAAFAPAAPETLRRAPQRAQDRPRQHRRDNGDAERQREYRQRGLDAPAAPRQRDVAALIGNPCRAGRCERDQHQEQNDPIHEGPMVRRSWRAPPSHRRRIDGRPRARHRGHRPCRARLARRRDRPAPASSIRAAPRRNRCAAPPP